MQDAVRKVVHSLKQDRDNGCKWHTYNFMWITWWLVGEGVLELLEAQVWQESDTQGDGGALKGGETCFGGR